MKLVMKLCKETWKSAFLFFFFGNLPFFKIHVNCFMAQNDSPCANAISK